jgi:hypothetical protein
MLMWPSRTAKLRGQHRLDTSPLLQDEWTLSRVLVREDAARIKAMRGPEQSSKDVQHARSDVGGQMRRKMQARIKAMRGSEQPSKDAQDAWPPVGELESRNAIDGREEMYKVAYAESQRSIDDQTDELKGMRDRAVSFTTFVGAATAFLVGTGLQAVHKDPAFYTLAIIASALSALWILLLIILLNPKDWGYRRSPRTLISDWIEIDVPRPGEITPIRVPPPPTTANFFRWLAIENDETMRANKAVLKSVRKYYQRLIIAGSAQVTVWAVLVWLKH